MATIVTKIIRKRNRLRSSQPICYSPDWPNRRWMQMADCVKWIGFKGCALSTSKSALTFAFRPICSAYSLVSAKLLRFVFQRRNSHHFQLKAIASACRYHHHYCDRLHHNSCILYNFWMNLFYFLILLFCLLLYAFCSFATFISFVLVIALHSQEHRFCCFSPLTNHVRK